MHIYDHDIVNYQTIKALQSIFPDCPYTQNRNKSRGSVSSTLLLHVLLYYSVQYGKSCSGHPYNCVYITLYVCHRVAE